MAQTTKTRISAARLGENRGAPRIYLNGLYLLRAGFEPGRQVAARFERGRVTILLDEAGDRLVSSKKAGTVPVLDINSKRLGEAFAGRDLEVRVSEGRIEIRESRTARRRAERVANGKEGSIFSGGGLLTQAATDAGFTPAWAVEIDPRFAEAFEANHPTARMLNVSAHEVDPADLEPVELVTAGIPCTPFSRKRTGAAAEQHELADMVFWALRIVEATNPRTVLIEQVPEFLEHALGQLCLATLERMGYEVESRVIDSRELGELAGRQRAVIVATTDGAFSWPESAEPEGTVDDVLDDVPADSDEWFDAESKPWLFAHWDKQRAAGRRFRSPVIRPGATRLPAVTKRYFSGQGDGAVVAHPTLEGTYRWLRLGEVARAMGLPAGYVLPAAKTVAGQVLGQGVVVTAFTKVLCGLSRQPAQLALFAA
jgi:DNA (cytosine-5)-methyltransferase 1